MVWVGYAGTLGLKPKSNMKHPPKAMVVVEKDRLVFNNYSMLLITEKIWKLCHFIRVIL